MDTSRRDWLKLFGAQSLIVPLIGGSPMLDAPAKLIEEPKIVPAEPQHFAPFVAKGAALMVSLGGPTLRYYETVGSVISITQASSLSIRTMLGQPFGPDYDCLEYRQRIDLQLSDGLKAMLIGKIAYPNNVAEWLIATALGMMGFSAFVSKWTFGPTGNLLSLEIH